MLQCAAGTQYIQAAFIAATASSVHLYTLAYDNAAYLQVLGDGELTLKLTIKAAKFSGSAKEKIQAAGGEAVEVPQKEKWTRALGRRRAAAAAAAAPPAGSKKKTTA